LTHARDTITENVILKKKSVSRWFEIKRTNDIAHWTSLVTVIPGLMHPLGHRSHEQTRREWDTRILILLLIRHFVKLFLVVLLGVMAAAFASYLILDSRRHSSSITREQKARQLHRAIVRSTSPSKRIICFPTHLLNQVLLLNNLKDVVCRERIMESDIIWKLRTVKESWVLSSFCKIGFFTQQH
jgi:hypothetical protein